MTTAQVTAQTGMPLTDAAINRLRNLTADLTKARQANVDHVAAQLLDQLHDQIGRSIPIPDQRKVT